MREEKTAKDHSGVKRTPLKAIIIDMPPYPTERSLQERMRARNSSQFGHFRPDC
jgi:hypothetical protein